MPGAASSMTVILFLHDKLALACSPNATQLHGKSLVNPWHKQEVVLSPCSHVFGRGGLVEVARMWVC